MTNLARHITYELGTALDRIAVRLAIWALKRLFSECAIPHDPHCAGCHSARVLANLRRTQERLRE